MLKKCFFICPIGEEGSEARKRSDNIMNYILYPVCEEKGYEVIRADLIPSANKISIDIINHLENDDLAIADLSGHNPNVFYEIGYRKAKNMPITNIAEKGTVLPFDTYDDRTIFYNLNDIVSINNLKKSISSTIDNIHKYKNSIISNSTASENEIVNETKPYINVNAIFKGDMRRDNYISQSKIFDGYIVCVDFINNTNNPISINNVFMQFEGSDQTLEFEHLSGTLLTLSRNNKDVCSNRIPILIKPKSILQNFLFVADMDYKLLSNFGENIVVSFVSHNTTFEEKAIFNPNDNLFDFISSFVNVK